MISCLQIHRNNKHRHCAVWFGLRFAPMVLWICVWLGLLVPGHLESEQTVLASCDAINSYHLFPLRLRRRSCKLNVAPLLLFLKPQEDLHTQLTEPIFTAAHEKGERLFVCPDKGSGNTTVKQRQQALHGCTFCHLDPKEIHNGNVENLRTVKPLQGPHFQPMLQSKMAEL